MIPGCSLIHATAAANAAKLLVASSSITVDSTGDLGAGSTVGSAATVDPMPDRSDNKVTIIRADCSIGGPGGRT